MLSLHLLHYLRSFMAGMYRRKQTLSLYFKCNSMHCLKKGALKTKQSIFINYSTLPAVLLSIHIKTHREFPTGFSDRSQAGRAGPALSPVKPRGWLHIWDVGSHHQHWCSSHYPKVITTRSQSTILLPTELPQTQTQAALTPSSEPRHSLKTCCSHSIYFLFPFKQALKYTLHLNKLDKTVPPDSCNCTAALSRSISAFCMLRTCLLHSNLT